MKVVVMDELKSRKQKIADMLEEKGHNVICCSATGEFMEAIETSTPNKILLDVESWQHGMAMYTYFKFAKNLVNIPIIFYNAPENFAGILDRGQNQNDKILNKQGDIDVIVSDL